MTIDFTALEMSTALHVLDMAASQFNERANAPATSEDMKVIYARQAERARVPHQKLSIAWQAEDEKERTK